MDTQERYYIQRNPIGDSWELWERLPQGEHRMQAEFFDGNEKSSPLAEIILSFLNAVVEIGKSEEGEQDG